MTTVIFYPDGPQSPDTSVITEAQCLAAWVLQANLPGDNVHVWREQITNETHIGVNDLTDELLRDPDTTFHVSPKPCGPETWIPIIISVAIGVASAVLFTPDVPIASATNSNTTSNNSISQRANQPRINQRLPDIRGKEAYAVPDLWMTYSKFKNNREFEVSYMCLSTGEVEVDMNSVNDGDTYYGDIQGAAVEFYGPNTSPNSGAPFLSIGSPITDKLYEVRRSNEVDGSVLPPPNIDRLDEDFYAFPTGRIEIPAASSTDLTSIFVVGEQVTIADFYSWEETTTAGEYTRHDCSGTFTVLVVEPEYIGIDLAGSTTQWGFYNALGELVRSFAYQNDSDPLIWMFTSDPAYTRIDWVPTAQPVVDIVSGPFNVSGFPDVWINLIAGNGLYKKSQTVTFITVDFLVTFKDTDAIGPDVPHNISMSSNQEDAVQVTFEFDVPYDNCTITVERTSDTDKEFEGTVVDEVKWRDLYAANPVTQANFGDVTTVFALTRATDSALRQKERKFNCACTRVITRPNGTRVASDTFADVIYSLHTDPFIGRRDESTIDHVGLYALEATVQNYFGSIDAIRCGFTFDDDSYRYEDHLTLICGAVNLTPYQVGSEIKFFFEQPQAISVQQFGHRSKVPPAAGGNEQRNRAMFPRDDYDGIELSYKDEITGQFETIYMPTDQSATNPDVIEYLGCITAKMAKVRVDRLFQKLRYQRITHGFDALDKARLLAQGQRIDVIDNTRFTGTDGYVTEVNGLEYVLSQPVDISTGDWSIVLTKRDGTLEGIPVSPSSEDDSVILQYAPSEPAYVGYLADKTEYNLSTDNLKTSLAMLVDTIDPSEIDNVQVTCINYDVRYYTGDLTPLA